MACSCSVQTTVTDQKADRYSDPVFVQHAMVVQTVSLDQTNFPVKSFSTYQTCLSSEVVKLEVELGLGSVRVLLQVENETSSMSLDLQVQLSDLESLTQLLETLVLSCLASAVQVNNAPLLHQTLPLSSYTETRYMDD